MALQVEGRCIGSVSIFRCFVEWVRCGFLFVYGYCERLACCLNAVLGIPYTPVYVAVSVLRYLTYSISASQPNGSRTTKIKLFEATPSSTPAEARYVEKVFAVHQMCGVRRLPGLGSTRGHR